MPAKNKAISNVLSLREVIRGRGLRSTGSRLAVLRALHKAERPLSHPELTSLLGDSGYDQATIYRNLTDLTEAGLLARTDLGDHVWRFEVVTEGASHGTSHPHFVCTACGVVACLTDCRVEVTAARGAPKSVRKREIAVQVQGRCDDCA